MTSLAVLLIEDDPATTDLVANVLRPWHDELQVVTNASEVIEAMPRADVALVDLQVQKGAGLALVHFFRARDPDLAIVAFTPAGDAEAEVVAHALGVNATVPKPLTGDALLVALSPIREKKALRVEAAARQRTLPLADLLQADDLHTLARTLARTATNLTGGPVRVELHDARQRTIEVCEGDGTAEVAIALVARDEIVGTLYISQKNAPERARAETTHDIDALALTAASVASLLRRVDSVARTGIKDPETSAYTFAYFVDVAGREIVRASRHQRRFGLLTFRIDNYATLQIQYDTDALRQARRELVDTILDTVRDSDVLAHIEDDEMYLLLPETGRLGALSCRRRIAEKQRRRAELARLEGLPSLSVSIGVASFPQDGRDLASLLRAAQQRAHNPNDTTGAMALLRKDAHAGLEAMLGALLRYRPDENTWQLRQAALAADKIFTIASAVAREATRGPGASDGVMYILGDRSHPLVRGAIDATRMAGTSNVQAYYLRPRAMDRSESSSGARTSPVEIEIDGTLVGPFVLLAVLTEAWAYACIASEHGEYKRVMHTADLDLVETLVAELQQTFHLQRGLE